MALPFLWGAATSSHQVEGDNHANDWWHWERAQKVKEPSGRACNHYQKFREDFEIASKLGHTAHRFSIEWSRLEPEKGVWNNQAFDHYREVLEDLRHRGIEPFVTLHHFTNPEWFAHEGGWLNPESVNYFAKYVKRIVKALGDHVQYWVTINEPLVFLYYGYSEGTWPPGHRSFSDSMKVFRNLLLAHLKSYQAIHRHYETVLRKPVQVSIAKHMIHFTPCRKTSFKDQLITFLRDRFFARSAIMRRRRRILSLRRHPFAAQSSMTKMSGSYSAMSSSTFATHFLFLSFCT